MSYQARIVDAELAARLGATGGVVIEGPKACGKTATARRFAASEVLLDVDEGARLSIGIDPGLVLDGATPRLIDEWQLAPDVWNAARRTIDDRGRPGQFILTGSAVPADDEIRHTGAGRLTRVRMRPMSLFVSGHSSGAISLGSLMDGGSVRSPEIPIDLLHLAERIASGGWPGSRHLPAEQQMQAVRGYLDEIRRVDVPRVDGTRRDPAKVGALLRSLARNVATHAAMTTLASDVRGGDATITDETVRNYLDALTRLMIVEDQPAWSPRLRSRSVLRSAPKRHFVDPSLAVAALRATPERLVRDLLTLGFLFESLVVRDLRVYAQALDGQIFQYRDSSGLEVDAIVEAADGRWAAFEVKLGGNGIEDGAANLAKFARRVDAAEPPCALGVIIGGGYGYVRRDGIAVIPIAALKP